MIRDAQTAQLQQDLADVLVANSELNREKVRNDLAIEAICNALMINPLSEPQDIVGAIERIKLRIAEQRRKDHQTVLKLREAIMELVD